LGHRVIHIWWIRMMLRQNGIAVIWILHLADFLI
jgi:hypothetical protein